MQARDEIGMATQVEAKGVNMVREEGRSEAEHAQHREGRARPNEEVQGRGRPQVEGHQVRVKQDYE